MNAAIFLDRDNTLIYADGDIAEPSQVRLLQGVPSAIASLRGLGYKIVVVTNQDGIANGRYSEDQTDAVHMKINEQIGNISGTSIDRFYYCPFHPDAILERYRKDHAWRKPNPGMIQQAGKDLELDLSASWLISSDPSDIKAGYAAGVRTMLLTHESEDLIPLKLEEVFINQTRALLNKEESGPYFTARSLVEAVRIIAQQRRPDFPEDRVVKDRFGRKIDAAPAKPRPAPQFQAQLSPTEPAQDKPRAQTPASQEVDEQVPPLFAQAGVAHVSDAPVSRAEPQDLSASVSSAAGNASTDVSPAPQAAPAVSIFEPAPADEDDDVAETTSGHDAAQAKGSIDLRGPDREGDTQSEEVQQEETESDGLAAGALAFEDQKADPEPARVVSPAAVEIEPAGVIVSPAAAQVGSQAVAKPQPQPQPTRPVGQSPSQVAGQPARPVKPVEPARTASASADQSSDEGSGEADAELAGSEKLPPAEVQLQRLESSVRQILQELRAGREVVQEMTFTTVLGLVFQGLAVVCLVGALFLGSGSPDAFQRWVLVGLMLQLGSIAAILIRR
jgi:D-glycero-D-manno-heptose 1,7-bisphosphate phosphatase